ncbi:MAG: TonB family protein [Myxococcota bacterium]
MSQSRLWLFCTCVSLAGHVALAGFLGVQAFLQKPTPKPQPVIRVRLVSHSPSKTTKTKLLPRKQSAAASGSAKKAKKSSRRPSQSGQSLKKPAKRQQAKTNSYQKALSQLDSLVGSQSQWRQTHQKQFADQLNQELKQDYAQRVQSLIQNAYRLPNVLSPFEKTHLRVFVHLSIGSQGNLLHAQIQKPSQNSVFDQAVIEGAKQVAPFGPPPKHQVDYYRTQGITLEFCPTACPP